MGGDTPPSFPLPPASVERLQQRREVRERAKETNKVAKKKNSHIVFDEDGTKVEEGGDQANGVDIGVGDNNKGGVTGLTSQDAKPTSRSQPVSVPKATEGGENDAVGSGSDEDGYEEGELFQYFLEGKGLHRKEPVKKPFVDLLKDSSNEPRRDELEELKRENGRLRKIVTRLLRGDPYQLARGADPIATVIYHRGMPLDLRREIDNMLSSIRDAKRAASDRLLFPAEKSHHQCGCVQYYQGYCMDWHGVQNLISDQAGTNEAWNLPEYSRHFNFAFPLSEAEADLLRFGSGRGCFNCGEAGHSVADCPQPKNQERIRQNRKADQQEKGEPASRGPREMRYFVDEERKKKIAKFQPGKPLSEALMKALGMESALVPPPYLFSMRAHGYPPGYMSGAGGGEEQKKGDGVLKVYHDPDDKPNEGGECGMDVEKGPNDDDAPVREKLVVFPGLNGPIPEGATPGDWEPVSKVRRVTPGRHQQRGPRTPYTPNTMTMATPTPPHKRARYDEPHHTPQYGGNYGGQNTYRQSPTEAMRHDHHTPPARYSWGSQHGDRYGGRVDYNRASPPHPPSALDSHYGPSNGAGILPTPPRYDQPRPITPPHSSPVTPQPNQRMGAGNKWAGIAERRWGR